ncbi:MAG: flotillin family protein [Gemmatimonadales bacterium]|nr:MAG: flotillin family protein [Gemmatimonadales bacterium]
MAEIAVVLGFVAVGIIVAAVVTVKSLIVIVPPNQAAIITGRRTGSGEDRRSYRTLRGGRALRIPIIEKVDRISLSTIPLEVTVQNAYSKGNIPLAVQAVANIKIAWDPPQAFDNAIERHLPFNREAVEQQAKETLAANLRGVLATMTPEDVNENRIKFAEELQKEAHDDMFTLGLTIDTIRIQNVSDDVDYLASVGRMKTAEVVRDAEIAEAIARAETAERSADADRQARIAQADADAEAKEREADATRRARVAEADADAEAREREADSRRRADVARAQADLAIAAEQNQLRVKQAEFDEEAMSRERMAEERAKLAEERARLDTETQRAETEQARLDADVIRPARAEREAAEERAKAEAAPILARGRAEAEVLEMLAKRIREGGDDAVTVLVLEKLPELLRTSVDATKDIAIERLFVMDQGDGTAVGNATNQRLRAAAGLMEQVTGYTGLSLEDLLAGVGRRSREAAGGTGQTSASVAEGSESRMQRDLE